MSLVVGIDLGTTNSCVAVPDSADVRHREELLAQRRLVPAGGALVITNQLKERTTASAVWVDEDGTVLVGSRAKQMARRDDVPPPALFFKRAMGTDRTVVAGYRTMVPEEASAHVLAHLKALAEEVLGEPVERAVVTVPAFFGARAKNLTTEAGERAGLEIVETLLEPVAAALMYTRTRELVDPTTFMVYDLGGGTFDDSVVSWDPEVGFENRSFHGDAFLGGYDFDARIVSWMLAQPDLDGYDLDLDDEDPADRAIRYRLLQLAEQAKHDLSREAEAQIRDATISDRSGAPMNISLYLGRDEFDQLIAASVRGTLDSCDEALGRAGVLAGDLSGIVMVGGSSRIPSVRDLIAERFGQQPTVIDPDLCVAVGAALKAATVSSRSSHFEVEHVPGTTSLTSIDVGGRVPDAGSRTAVLALRSDDGTHRDTTTPNDEGGFLFLDVPLAEDARSDFTVELLADGQVVDRQRLSVVHDPDAGARDVIPEGDILAKDFSVAVRDGRSVVARAGTKLPYRAATVNLETANQRGEVLIEFFEDITPVGNVRVPDLPADLPVGSAVNVVLHFEKGWTISGSAAVPAADVTVPVSVRLPDVVVPTRAELTERLTRIRAAAQEVREVAPPAELLRVGHRIDELLESASALVADGHDPIHAHHTLSEIETLLRDVRTAAAPTDAALHPPLAEFEAALGELEDLIRQLDRADPNLAARHRVALESLRSNGRTIHARGNAVDWAAVNDDVRRRITSTRSEVPGAGPRSDLPPAPVLQLLVGQELREIIETVTKARRRPDGGSDARFEALFRAGHAVHDRVMAVDLTEEKRATSELVALYQSEVMPLRARIDDAVSEASAEHLGPGADLRLPPSSMR